MNRGNLNHVELIEKPGENGILKQILVSSNPIGRAAGIAIARDRWTIEEDKEHFEFRKMEGAKWKIPLFFKFIVEHEDGTGNESTYLVGPNIFLDSENMQVNVIRAFFDKQGKVKTIIRQLDIETIDDCILKLQGTFRIKKGSLVRTQYLKNKVDQAPWDMLIFPYGDSQERTYKFIRRWKWA